MCACRCEEAELAAAVGSRRAMAAEVELDRLKVQLTAAEQRAKELAWQVKMMSDPSQIGGRNGSDGSGPGGASGSAGGQVAGIFDMFGCATNYRGK